MHAKNLVPPQGRGSILSQELALASLRSSPFTFAAQVPIRTTSDPSLMTLCSSLPPQGFRRIGGRGPCCLPALLIILSTSQVITSTERYISDLQTPTRGILASSDVHPTPWASRKPGGVLPGPFTALYCIRIPRSSVKCLIDCLCKTRPWPRLIVRISLMNMESAAQSSADTRYHTMTTPTPRYLPDDIMPGALQLNDMPPELLGKILGHLTAPDIQGLKLVGSVTAITPCEFDEISP